jgi:hypothetical protein
MTWPPRDEQKAALLVLARQLAPKPLLIGAGAVHLGWWAKLAETEAILDELVSEGTLRRATKAECYGWGIAQGYLVV